MARYAYGYMNHAFFSTGTTTWCGAKRERDAALAALRAEAIDGGLSESAALHGIVPVRHRYRPGYHPEDEAIAEAIEKHRREAEDER